MLNVLTVSDETSNSNHEQSAMPISSMTSSEKSYSSAIVAPVKNGVTFTPIEQEVLQNSSTSADNYSTSDVFSLKFNNFGLFFRMDGGQNIVDRLRQNLYTFCIIKQSKKITYNLTVSKFS